MPTWTYPAKLLLFGEYAVIDGGDALAMSWPEHGARWVAPGQDEPADAEGRVTRREQLGAFTRWLRSGASEEATVGLDLDRLEDDTAMGWWLAGDLRAGYGLGSSGAACAAIVDRYGNWRGLGSRDMQARFAALENFFHGSSSGLDPLVAYLGRGAGADSLLLRYGAGPLPERCDRRQASAPVWHGFLVDTGYARRTGPLVDGFRRRRQDPAFVRALQERLLPANADAIEAFLAGAAGPFGHALQGLSAATLALLEPMVAPELQSAWALGLQGTPEESPGILKLCGAGGGGYAFVWTTKPEAAQAALGELVMIPVLQV